MSGEPRDQVDELAKGMEAAGALIESLEEEVVNLRLRNLALPAEGWGEIHLEESTPHAGNEWTDGGAARDRRQLKHRGRVAVSSCRCGW